MGPNRVPTEFTSTGSSESDTVAVSGSAPKASEESDSNLATADGDMSEHPPVVVDNPSALPHEEPVETTRPTSQAGLLTAGSFDDHERLTEYREFLSHAYQSDHNQLTKQMIFGRRVMIRVVNAEGKPIATLRSWFVRHSIRKHYSALAPAAMAATGVSTGVSGS